LKWFTCQLLVDLLLRLDDVHPQQGRQVPQHAKTTILCNSQTTTVDAHCCCLSQQVSETRSLGLQAIGDAKTETACGLAVSVKQEAPVLCMANGFICMLACMSSCARLLPMTHGGTVAKHAEEKSR